MKIGWLLTGIGVLVLVVIVGELIYILVDTWGTPLHINTGRVLMIAAPAIIVLLFGVRRIRKHGENKEGS